ncbi:PqqD family protein [Micromonospora cathayae]|uniref:PqqD family protein n=1 Tax=Micromonospora cathayae TaxID=3028804 RepID=A0ABY7ZS43_9ACTN|nr:PqqD family protein [Micromonospora sp. HUAS 3]WDZ85852.1 PqqD family protein [Micromonospora sp. HUAS 3]
MPEHLAIGRDSVPRRRLDVRIRSYRGTLLVATADSAFELHDMAAFLVRRFDGVRTVAQVVGLLATEYGLPPAEAEADTLDLLGQLIDHGVLEVTG